MCVVRLGDMDGRKECVYIFSATINITYYLRKVKERYVNFILILNYIVFISVHFCGGGKCIFCRKMGIILNKFIEIIKKIGIFLQVSRILHIFALINGRNIQYGNFSVVKW